MRLRDKSRCLRVGYAIAILATVLMTATAEAQSVPVFGGPTYSPSVGGYIAQDLSVGLYPSAHVNDAGIVAASTHRLSSSGSSLGLRAVRWSASTPFVELGGGLDSQAEGINGAGTVIGDIGSGQSRGPARWSALSTAATPLEHPPVVGIPNGWGSPFLHDLNDAGTAVGAVWRTELDAQGIPVDLGIRPGRWDASGVVLTELGLLRANAAGFQVGEARAINSAGVAVGFSGKNHPDGSDAGWSAVRWDASAVGATELGNLGTAAADPFGTPAGRTESYAFAVNSFGTAVGYANVYDNAGQLLRQHAPVRWDSSGTATELGQLSANADASVVWSPATLNDAGTTVGWALKLRDNGSSLGTRAVRWDPSGTAATELGNLGTSFEITHSEALAVNAAGTIVGFADTHDATGTFSVEHAVYWGGDTLAIDLNTLLGSNSGWILNRALAISDTGWIVGNGMFDPDGAGGQAAYSRHFLMHVPATVPEPSGVALLAVTASALLRRRRRCTLHPRQLTTMRHV